MVRTIAAAAAVLLSTAALRALPTPSSRPAEAAGRYAVVVSRPTWDAPAWREVVNLLRTKYDAAVIVWDGDVTAARSALAEWMPRYACFVARPEEAGRDFVVAVHRLTRRLDDDPYTDVLWGILTGYEPADALRIAGRREPLIVRTALGGTGALNLDAFDAGLRFHEDIAGERFTKEPGKPTTREAFPDDSTEGIVQALNAFKPDLFLTSGHATERDWQIGYTYRDGQLRCENGRLFGLDTQDRRFDVHSPNPKVFLPVGNCLIGHIPSRDCMATALMHSAGVDQMFGYAAVTFYGYMGWGILDYFEAQRDRFTLAESFFCISQALLHTIQTRYPRLTRLEPDTYDLDAARHWADRYSLATSDEAGLLWDRDVVAFYGDPAWPVRRPAAQPAWEQSLDVQGDTYTLTVTARAGGEWPAKPIIHLMPHRIADAHVTHNEELMPVVTDNFVLVPLRGPRAEGDVHRIVFQAKTPSVTRASADLPPILVTSTSSQGEVPPAPVPSDVPPLVPEAYRPAVLRTLAGAGPNQNELLAAIRQAPETDRAAVCFLIANLPPPDARRLTAKHLLENTRWAIAARDRVPWGREIPESLFLNYVLPYASVNERRDNWRRDFFERFFPLVRDGRDPSEAALKLNGTIFGLLGVEYHASRRPKPDQSPSESMEAGYASCTGLSILLVDACRAVGVPARFVGTPQWTNASGNHSWVEVWDGQWHYLGAAEPDPAGLNNAWFTAQAAKADASQPMHRIYAASFRKTDTLFPLAWDLNLNWVSALDVTKQYTHRAPLAIRVLDRPGGRPGAVQIDVHWQGEPYARTRSDGTKDVTLNLPLGERFDATLTTPDGRTSQTTFTTPSDNPTRLVLSSSENDSATGVGPGPLWLAVGSEALLEPLAPLAQKRRLDGFEAILSSQSMDQALAAASQRPRYLLLVGDVENGQEAATWYLPSQSRELYRWRSVQPHRFPSDPAWGDVNGDGVPEIPVGRIPARTPDDVRIVVQKILAFEQQPPCERDLRASVWAGSPLYGPAFDALATGLLLTTIQDSSPAWLDPWIISADPAQPFCGWPPDQPVRFLRRMKEGGLLHVLIAHGTPTSVLSMFYDGREIQFTAAVASGAFASGPPAAPLVLLTCDAGNFTLPDPSLAELLLLLPGGPVAAIAATTESHPLTNYFTGQGLLRALGQADGRLGDVWLKAQQHALNVRNPVMVRILRDVEGKLEDEINVARLRRDQMLMYALLGDPATRMRTPRLLIATVEREGPVWRYQVQRPASATRLYVSFRATGRTLPGPISRPADREQANAAFENANTGMAFEPLEAPPADAPWSGTLDRPGTLRLVAIGDDCLYVAALNIEAPVE